MKILMIGDIYGRTGRQAVARYVPLLRKKYQLDFVIANADNASHGRGLNYETLKQLYTYDIDLLTGGDHIWDQRDLLPHLDRSPWVLRPLNYPQGTPGKGFHLLQNAAGKRLLVAHAMGRVFNDKLCEDPFAALDTLCTRYTCGRDTDAILVDFHAGATSEKMAMGHFLDGRVSAVLGTHTHIPTHDARLLAGGTAYITDLGMTGDYDSVIGAVKEVPINNFRTSLKLGHFSPADGEATLCGAIIETDNKTGKALAITQIRIGGVLGDPLSE